IGAKLGITEDAAKQRVFRGIEQLKSFFARRGVGITAAGLAAVLSAKVVEAAPAGLGAAVALAQTAAVHAAAHAAAGAATAPIAKGITAMMTLAKIKVAAVCMLLVALAGGTAGLILAQAGGD